MTTHPATGERLLAVPSTRPWAATAQPCLHCSIPTHRRDNAGRPAHYPPCTATENGTPTR